MPATLLTRRSSGSAAQRFTGTTSAPMAVVSGGTYYAQGMLYKRLGPNATLPTLDGADLAGWELIAGGSAGSGYLVPKDFPTVFTVTSAGAQSIYAAQLGLPANASGVMDLNRESTDPTTGAVSAVPVGQSYSSFDPATGVLTLTEPPAAPNDGPFWQVGDRVVGCYATSGSGASGGTPYNDQELRDLIAANARKLVDTTDTDPAAPRSSLANKVNKYTKAFNTKGYLTAQAAVDASTPGDNSVTLRGALDGDLTLGALNLLVDATSATFGLAVRVSIGVGGTTAFHHVWQGGAFQATVQYVPHSGPTGNTLVITDATVSFAAQFRLYLRASGNTVVDTVQFVRLRGAKTSGAGNQNTGLFNCYGDTYQNHRPLRLVLTDCDLTNAIGPILTGVAPAGTKLVLQGSTVLRPSNGKIQELNNQTASPFGANGTPVAYTDADIIVDERSTTSPGGTSTGFAGFVRETVAAFPHTSNQATALSNVLGVFSDGLLCNEGQDYSLSLDGQGRAVVSLVGPQPNPLNVRLVYVPGTTTATTTPPANSTPPAESVTITNAQAS